MSSNPLRLQYLINKYIKNECSSSELEEFWKLMLEFNDAVDPISEDLMNMWGKKYPDHSIKGDVNWDKAYEKMFEKVEIFEPAYEKNKNERIILRWFYYSGAACLALLICCGIFYYYFKKQDIYKNKTTYIRKNDVPPGITKAVLTLANGQSLLLDSTHEGNLAKQGGTNIIRRDGTLIYGGKDTGEVLYNTLSTGRGAQSPQLTLSDGTKVWLNAASSLRFPTIFKGNERVVELHGEGYFEVVHNSKKPFKVRTDQEEVEDVGTRFNIYAYADEAVTKTTVIEGQAKIRSGKKETLLSIGQQGLLHNNILRVNAVDPEQAVSWRNGYFSFDGEDLNEVLQQLSRWYNVDIIYSGKVQESLLFGGEMQRNLTLAQVLKILEKNGIHLKIEDRQLIVLPD